MTHNRRAIVALAMAAIMLLSVAGPAAAAAPVIDDEATNSPDQTELTDGATITYNSSSNSTLSVVVDSPNASVTVLQNETELQTFENGTDGELSQFSSNATHHFVNFTLPDDETGYQGVVAAPGETVSLTYRVANDSSVATPDTTNFTINWDNHANKSFDRYESGDVETAEAGTWQSLTAGVPLIGAQNLSSSPAQAEADVGVTGEDTDTVTVYVSDSDAQDALGATHDAAGDTGLSLFGTATVDGELVPVVASGEDGPEWLDTDEQTYATVNEAGDEVVVHNTGDSLGSDTETATLSAIGAEQANYGHIWSMTRNYGAGYAAAAGTALGGEFAVGGDQFEIGS